MSIENFGKKIDSIEVKISYRIIELFSAGLYSSPNKAFEELVCNSYDAFADKVSVYLPSDLTVDGSFIWVCDNGESMDQEELKDLWNIGVSNKRNLDREKKRLQIGRFGIGKLATYVLANRLTYICKKSKRFLATTMNYETISDQREKYILDEREINEDEVQSVIEPYIHSDGNDFLQFNLFGDNAAENWTFSIMTGLKPKAAEITEGRLKWILQTALPLSPGFKLFFNGNEIKSSKSKKPIKKIWTIGKDDLTAATLDYASCRIDGNNHYVDFENLKNVRGTIELYEDSLVDGSKASLLGRSHGIFLMVRGRLVNIDDPLLGMEAFSHGAFNRTRIQIFADELDANLTSTRESIKESIPLKQLKAYIQKKFNNEVRKYYFDEERKKDRESSFAYRISQTSLTLSKRPLYVFAKKFFENKIINPILIEKPSFKRKDELLAELKEDLSSDESIIKNVNWMLLEPVDPIAKLDLMTGNLKINLLHPFIANYCDDFKSTLPVEFIATTEVLTEAHLYELGIDESNVNSIMRRRDTTLRELSLSDREGSPAVAQLLKDSISDPTGLEDAVYRAFLALGFEVSKIGKTGKPDGIATALLGFSDSDSSENYSFTYDSKSTKGEKIQAGTAKLAAIKRHQTDYSANYSVVISVDFQGASDPQSAISKEATQQKVTIMKVEDLIRLLLLSAPKQIGLNKIRDLFENCHTPLEVSKWIDQIEKKRIIIGPVKDLLETIYDLQKNDTEPPEISTVRLKLNDKIPEKMSKTEIKLLIGSLKVFVPGFISLEGDKVGIQGHPSKVFKVINGAINDVPNKLQEIYLKAFSSSNVDD